MTDKEDKWMRILSAVLGAVAILLLLILFSCQQNPSPVATGCWTGIKDGKRQLIGCYTQAQVVAAEQSQSWALLLVQYSGLKYEYSQTCEQCRSKYK